MTMKLLGNEDRGFFFTEKSLERTQSCQNILLYKWFVQHFNTFLCQHMNTESAWTHSPLGDHLWHICHFINKWDYGTTSDPHNLHHTPHPSMTPRPCLVITVMVYGFLAGALQQQCHPALCPPSAPAGVASTFMTWIPHLHTNLTQGELIASYMFVCLWRVCCSGVKVTPEQCPWVLWHHSDTHGHMIWSTYVCMCGLCTRFN